MADAGDGKAAEIPLTEMGRLQMALKVATSMKNLHALVGMEVPRIPISFFIGKLLDGEERKMLSTGTCGNIPIVVLEETIRKMVGAEELHLYLPLVVIPGKLILALKPREDITLWHWHKTFLGEAEEEKDGENIISRMPVIAVSDGKVINIGKPPDAVETAHDNSNKGWGNFCILNLGDKFESVAELLD